MPLPRRAPAREALPRRHRHRARPCSGRRCHPRSRPKRSRLRGVNQTRLHLHLRYQATAADEGV
eukprot:7362886-Pyramimonas_sp.AAC.1